MLATGSKDGCLFLWDIDPDTYKLTLNKCYEDHSCGVCYVSWSPDDRYIIVCGPEESNELWIWDVEVIIIILMAFWVQVIYMSLGILLLSNNIIFLSN